MLRSLNEITSQFRKACQGAGFPVGHGEDMALAATWLVAHDLDGTAALLEGLATGFDLAFPPVRRSHDADGRMSLVVESLKVASHGPGLRDLLLAAPGTTVCEIGTADSPLLLFAMMGQASELPGCHCAWSTGNSRALVLECGTINGSPDKSDICANGPAAAINFQLTSPNSEYLNAGAVHAPVHFHAGFRVNEESWPQVSALAARTYVPASQASRISGAGAAIDDND